MALPIKQNQLKIVNSTFSAKLSRHIDLLNISYLYPFQVTFNRNKFSGIIFPAVVSREKFECKKEFLLRKKRKGRGKVLLFSNGKVIVTGCLNYDEARNRICDLLFTIKKECRILDLTLLNIVVSGCVNYTLPLDYLFTKLDHWKSLEYELFPGLIVKRGNISYTLFRSGRYFATGLRSDNDISSASKFFKHIHELVKHGNKIPSS